ncbi:hypothetical protein B0H14DRAFT_3446708 [Mycena olivaceomarginata]|nr:hypothetical protein B0H14DRAFT_3446708 [Mycena olivaceomarginata]
MLPPKKSVLAWTSIFLALASQVSAFAPASGSTVSIKGRNDDDGSLVARKAPSIAQLAAKNKGKKVVFAACAKDSECQQGCCGFKTGKCAGPDNGNLKAAATQQAAAFAAQLDKLPFKPSKRDIADESVEELSRRETALELEAREDDDDDDFDDDDNEFED